VQFFFFVLEEISDFGLGTGTYLFFLNYYIHLRKAELGNFDDKVLCKFVKLFFLIDLYQLVVNLHKLDQPGFK
jgi:hypothetical protein